MKIFGIMKIVSLKCYVNSPLSSNAGIIICSGTTIVLTSEPYVSSSIVGKSKVQLLRQLVEENELKKMIVEPESQ